MYRFRPPPTSAVGAREPFLSGFWTGRSVANASGGRLQPTRGGSAWPGAAARPPPSAMVACCRIRGVASCRPQARVSVASAPCSCCPRRMHGIVSRRPRAAWSVRVCCPRRTRLAVAAVPRAASPFCTSARDSAPLRGWSAQRGGRRVQSRIRAATRLRLRVAPAPGTGGSGPRRTARGPWCRETAPGTSGTAHRPCVGPSTARPAPACTTTSFPPGSFPRAGSTRGHRHTGSVRSAARSGCGPSARRILSWEAASFGLLV